MNLLDAHTLSGVVVPGLVQVRHHEMIAVTPIFQTRLTAGDIWRMPASCRQCAVDRRRCE